MLTRLLFAIFAICFISSVYCRAVEDEETTKFGRCSEDFQQRCLNFTTAIECNAVKYCIDTIWSKAQPIQGDNTCSTCVSQINNIREGIASNITKQVIKEALDYVCEISIFTRILRKECEDLIDTYVDHNINELLDLLKSDVNPQTICHIIGLCSSAEDSTDTSSEDVVVHYDNIVLHFPSHNMQIISNIYPSTDPPELLGSKRCTWGPSYWCGNLTTSKECASTNHCITSYWSKKEYEEDNDSVCQVCKDMVKQARDQLLSNETREELREVFEGSCKLIPVKEIRKECIVLADEFIPELIEMLASQMNPTAVCTVAGLCNSRRIDNLLAAEAKKNTNLAAMNSCVNCTVAVTSFKNFMESATKDEVLQRVLLICNELSSYSDLCASLIVSNFDDIYNMRSSQLQPFEVCHLSGMCAYKYHFHPSDSDVDFQHQVDNMLAVKNDDLPCDLCKQLVHHFQEILIANTTEEEFLQILHGICEQTGKFKSDCLQLVDENFKIIYKFLTEEIDPAKICAEIQICPRSKNYVSDENLNLISGRVIPVLTDEVKLTNLMPVSPQQVNITDNTCRFCKTIIGIIQAELKDPTYEDDIVKALDKVCTLMPKEDKDKCQNFINDYADILIKTLADETDPGIVCATLRICPNPNDISKPVKGEFCSFCQYLLHFIQQALQDPKDETKIEEAVKKVCNIIPNAEKNKCEEFISQYAALLISILSTEIDPSLVCPALKLCPSTVSPQQKCNHCRIFISNLINQLENNYELLNIKNKMSSLTPVKGMEKSLTTVQLKTFHHEDLIDMMSAEFDADESCVYLKFCDINTVTAQLSTDFGGDIETNEIVDVLSKNKFGTPTCEVCQLFVKLYEKELTSPKSEKEVEDLLKRFCAQMTNPDMQSNCSKLVDKYVPIFFDLLKKDVSPKELCAAAKLCSLNTILNNVDTKCRTCEVAVGSLESVLGDPTIKENVFEEAVKVCDYMVGKSHSICVEVISELFPQIEGIVFDIPAWYVCTKMEMCPYGSHVEPKVCSNPELWCQDKKTAFLCGRLQFCAKNAWSSSVPSL